MKASENHSTDFRTVIAPANALLFTSISTILVGIVLATLGTCFGLSNGGHTSHLSISYISIPIILAGCVTLVLAVVRIVSTNKCLSSMNLTLDEFKKQWDQEDYSAESTSVNIQKDVYNSVSSSVRSIPVNKSDSVSLNVGGDGDDDDNTEFPKPLTNHHQRLPMPPRRAMLD